MAARLRKFHSDEIRQKIQASCIIDRLQKHINGDVDMTSTQVSAAMGLLDRSVPKLSQIQHVGDEDNPVHINSTMDVSNISTDSLKEIMAAVDEANKD